MFKGKYIVASVYVFISMLFFIFVIPNIVKGNEKGNDAVILRSSTEKINLYDTLYLLKDNDGTLTIEDVASDSYEDKFVHADSAFQKGGFYDSFTWLRFEVDNQMNHENWLLEIAYPIIFQVSFYSKDELGIKKLQETGVIYPYHQREINHRNFVFTLDVEPNVTKTYYILVHAAGDMHPPINIWKSESFIQKTQIEFILLGLFYGMTSIMVFYNLFLYFSLRLKSYLYYVLLIVCTIMAYLQNNGLGYQYLWPNSPGWNTIANPVFVSLACIFILMFTRSFLDTDKYHPKFTLLSNTLIIFNAIVIILLFITHLFALNLMLLSTTSTFVVVLSAAIICLRRGARQARFFIVGWSVFLLGVAITILSTAAIIPHSNITEFAGQFTTGIEVILLSLALADKITIMRADKEKAEKDAIQSQSVAMASLKKADELKDEFLAITSHELRTPLYGMIGIAESLRDGITGNVSREMNDQLSMIVSSGNRLTHLVNDILDFSKLKHNSLDVQLMPVHLAGVVDVIFTICQPLIKSKPLKLINNINTSLPPVIADKNRLQQILYNLIGNAVKYTDAGEVVISAEIKGELIKISVSDTGRGISRELQKTIFEPFIQGDNSLSRDVGGTGIGLSITQQLVNLHGGEIELESKVGKGSTFSFYLPIQTSTKVIEEVALTIEPILLEEPTLSTPTLHFNREKAKILVADDEPVNLQVLMNQLTLEGYEVITASNGEEALRIVEEQTIELLILDIMMPNMSGYTVCQQLRKKYSLMELPILMLTAKNQVHDRITSFEVGANDYLAKPCDKQELLSRVKTLVRLRSLNQELITLNLQLEEKVEERTKALEVANVDLTEMNEELKTMAESRRNLLANIAHELGTPVTLIHGYVQALQQGLVDTNDSYFSNLVYDKINVLSRLIYDLTDLSKLEAGQTSLDMKIINLNIWIEQIYSKVEFDIMQYERISVKPKNVQRFEFFCCLIDIERMDQVFSNLIRNAVKNTSEKDGEIKVSASLDEANNLVIIQVKDNGKGISDENQPLIFERFFKSASSNGKDTQNGTGLGLAIVKEIIQGHGGEIWVESKLNEGSIFFMALPIHKDT